MQNSKDAAIKAGYSPLLAEMKAAKLLQRSDIQAMISELSTQKTDEKLMQSVIAGLSRLAFASNADSLKLMLLEKPILIDQLDKLDLFHISEIKIPKDGALEIKFFDRFKAFEKLLDIARYKSGGADAAEFFTALEKSAQSINEVKCDDEI